MANILLLGLFGPVLNPPGPDDPSNNGSQEDDSIVVADAKPNAGGDSEGIVVTDDVVFDLPTPPLDGAAGAEGGTLLASVTDFDTSNAEFVSFDDSSVGGGTDAGGGGGAGAGGGDGTGGGGGGPLSGFPGGGLGGPGGAGGGGGGNGGNGGSGGSGPKSDLPTLAGNDEINGPAAVPEPGIALLCAGALGLMSYLTVYRRSRLQPRTARTR